MLADDGTSQGIRQFTHGHGADAVFDCVGNDSTLALGVASARTLGDLTIIGLGGGTLPIGFFTVPYELSVQTTYWGSRPELIEVLDLAARGHIHATITTFPLDEAADAYRRLAAGEVTGRAVIVPNAS